MFYVMGSLLFMLAMAAALAVMARDIGRYRGAMGAALRSLSLDGWAGRASPSALDAAPAVRTIGRSPRYQPALQRQAAA
jgi:hypothetical protein